MYIYSLSLDFSFLFKTFQTTHLPLSKEPFVKAQPTSILSKLKWPSLLSKLGLSKVVQAHTHHELYKLCLSWKASTFVKWVLFQPFFNSCKISLYTLFQWCRRYMFSKEALGFLSLSALPLLSFTSFCQRGVHGFTLTSFCQRGALGFTLTSFCQRGFLAGIVFVFKPAAPSNFLWFPLAFLPKPMVLGLAFF